MHAAVFPVVLPRTGPGSRPRAFVLPAATLLLVYVGMRVHFRKRCASRLLAILVLAPAINAYAKENDQQPIGSRPYEMVWAGRTEDTRPPLVDFEGLDGWTVECRQAEAEWTRSRRQQLWN